MTEIQFSETPVAIPVTTVTRASEPNPFDGHFPTAEGVALPATITAATEKDLAKAVTKAKNQARRAAAKVERSARVKEGEKSGDDKKGWAQDVLFWTVPQITRNRAETPTETPADEPTESPAEPVAAE